jgi:hypothetical protein
MSGTPIISKSGKYRAAPLGNHNALRHEGYAKSLCGISTLSMKKLVISKIWIYELFRIEPAVIETMVWILQENRGNELFLIRYFSYRNHEI